MVRQQTWLLAFLIFLTSANAFGEEKVFVSLSGQQMKLSEQCDRCTFSMEGVDVKRSGNCSLNASDRISISTTVLSFDVPALAFKIGSSGFVDSESKNSVEYIKDFTMFGKKLDDVFVIHSMRSKPFEMQFRTLFSLKYGIIGFQKNISEGLDSVWVIKEL